MIYTTIKSGLRGTLYNFTRSRKIHIYQAVCSANQSPLFKLRQKTGLAYSLCREALNKHENNVEEAEAWLKAQALAHGLQKATKVRDRSAREGLIGIAVSRDQKLATVLELNCETDFVAKNNLFKDLILKLTEQIAAKVDECDVLDIKGHNSLKELRPTRELLASLDGQVVPIISKLGENIRLRRTLHLKSEDARVHLFGQVHAQAGQKETSNSDIFTGRFGAITVLKEENQNSHKPLESLKAIGDRLCRHVIGFSPTYIELPDNIRKHLEEVEKERLSNQVSVEHIEGEEEFSDDENNRQSTNNRDDWPSIMDQQLIMSEDLIVRDFCRENQVSIVHFQRFECGDDT